MRCIGYNGPVAEALLRNFSWKDLPTYARLVREAGQADGARSPFTDQDAQEYLHQPNLNPERDCYMAETDGEAAGYILVVPELGIQRTIIEGVVHPAFRRQGVGRRLLERGVRHSRALGARVAHASASPQSESQHLFRAVGFQEVRRQWQLRLEGEPQSLGAPATGYVVRPMAEGEEPILTQLQNRAFGGSWGFAPNTPEEIAYRVRMGKGRPEHTLFLVVGGRSLAYCWTRRPLLDGEPVGIVGMIGADPEARGLGLGRAMLLESIAYLRSNGARAVELTVYTDNTPAVELYRSTGFQVRGEIIWFERAL